MGLVLACQNLDTFFNRKKYQALKEEFYTKVKERKASIETAMEEARDNPDRLDYLTMVHDLLKICLRELTYDLGYEIEFD